MEFMGGILRKTV